MFKIQVSETKHVEFDLNALSHVEWPREAKQLAIYITQQPAFKKQLDEQLPELRKSWLVSKIYQLQEAEINL